TRSPRAGSSPGLLSNPSRRWACSKPGSTRAIRPSPTTSRKSGDPMTSANHPAAPAAELEQLRAIARQWGRAAWAQPCEAIPFRWRRFDLKNFSGRQELGRLPLWYKLCWVFALPFMLVFVLIYGILNELWLAGDVKSEDGKTERKLRPGLIQVRGTTKNSAATALI